MFLHPDREDSDQTGRMSRLWADAQADLSFFAGRTGHFVGFVVLRFAQIKKS